MRAMVVLLALLALAKVGYREHLFRSSTQDVIVAAYRERAVQACQTEYKVRAFGARPQLWANAAQVQVVIGKSGLDVFFWQVDNALWNARFRNPYLQLRTGPRPSGMMCEYDIVNGAAAVSRL